MKEQDKLKTKKDVIDFIECYISYRGGMSNRIDAEDILRMLKGKDKIYYKKIKRHLDEYKC